MAANPREMDATVNRTLPAREPDSEFEAAVKSMIDLYGPSLLFESERLGNFLQEHFPDSMREISLLVQAIDDQVPQDLLGVHSDEELGRLLPRLEKRLCDRKNLAPEASNWAVRTWARVLGISAVAPAALPPLLGLDEGPWFTNSEPIDIELPILEDVSNRGAPVDEPRVEPQPEAALVNPSGRRIALGAALAIFVAVALAIWFGSFYNIVKIARVSSSEPLVGDGKKREVFVAFNPRTRPVRSVEVQFVRGDERWDPRPFTIEVTPEADARGLAPAGQIGLWTTKPGTATFRYVLLTTDGRRSDPFEKTFEIAPGPAQPPVIKTISVPPGLTTGKPFALTIAYESGAAKIEQIELKVMDSTVAWPSREIVTRASDLPTSKPGLVSYPFNAINHPMRSALDFTLIDANGVRSEPTRVALEVAPQPIHVTSPPCTGTTCGRVIAVREIDPGGEGISGFISRLFERPKRGQKAYEITVRMDNGATHVLTQSARWNSGARVRIVGSTISLRCLEPRSACW